METLTLPRVASSEVGTYGVMVRNQIPLAVTCEDPWNNNQRSISCIPEGTYLCGKFNGRKYQDVWEVKDVPGRSAILIHQGNTINNTEGCILVGRGFYNKGDVHMITESRLTLDTLRVELPDSFYLRIINCF